jgi:hypothetical protein
MPSPIPAALAFSIVDGAISHDIANIPREPRILLAAAILSMYSTIAFKKKYL